MGFEDANEVEVVVVGAVDVTEEVAVVVCGGGSVGCGVEGV